MGSETRQIDAQIVEAEVTLQSTPDKPSLPDTDKG